ncbi:sporulation integral membrane protein YlbJ [Clostridium baratii]|uniref:sporulation integral membrane protein YlbJ n=1 Tax=Clostridium baratii TaxID=1561 RepID=UPI0009A2B016|nr:sporulation integral membrane protein YlbJ [Clostridium baratii]OPF51751.1 sporulation integral membrane protein YlbJ [Clostridium baratii]OPF53396.1 sporulation integral membrane protein YlbJ [Clostridium baratii]OPF57459.1 sporulation integral membrane protein YlbJ [Clostridium baratii]OPF60443.1 sporulation integral membrane protein YlbJ [Clostridium baratii]
MNSIFILSILIIVFLLVLLKLLNVKKHIIFCFLITFLIVLFVANIETSINAAMEGCKLCFRAVIPTVFSFSLICNLLISYNGIDLYSKILGPLLCRPLRLSKSCSFPLVASILSGYPLGAKYSSDLYELGHINKSEYERLLNIASNAGPIFIIGSVGSALLGSPKYGYFLLISSYLSLFFIGLITIKKAPSYKIDKKESSKFQDITFGSALDNAIKNAINTTLSVCGYIIAFSVIISIIKNNNFVSNSITSLESILNLPKNVLYGTFLGSIEMTNGCSIIANSSLSIHLKLAIVSFICSFSGMSAIAQASSFFSKHNVSIAKYMLLKLVQGAFSFVVSYFLSTIIFKTSEASNIVSASTSYNIILYILPIILFLLISLIICISKTLIHSS